MSELTTYDVCFEWQAEKSGCMKITESHVMEPAGPAGEWYAADDVDAEIARLKQALERTRSALNMIVTDGESPCAFCASAGDCSDDDIDICIDEDAVTYGRWQPNWETE